MTHHFAATAVDRSGEQRMARQDILVLPRPTRARTRTIRPTNWIARAASQFNYAKGLQVWKAHDGVSAVMYQ